MSADMDLQMAAGIGFGDIVVGRDSRRDFPPILDSMDSIANCRLVSGNIDFVVMGLHFHCRFSVAAPVHFELQLPLLHSLTLRRLQKSPE